MAEQDPNFGQYWTKIIKPDGKPASGLAFDDEKFRQQYGEETTNAYTNYRHYIGNPPSTPEATEAQRTAIETVTNTIGIAPNIIDQGRDNPQVEDLSEH